MKKFYLLLAICFLLIILLICLIVYINCTTKHQKKSKTMMIAHRGLSGYEKENTIPAFIAAGCRSFYGIECDIHPTSDGKFVVFHDDDTARISPINIKIEETTLEELKKVPLYDVKNEKVVPYYTIPTLEEYLEVCIRYQKQCIIEFKNVFKEEDIKKVIAIIKEYNYLDKVIFISFYIENLEIVKRYLPNQRAQFLSSKYDETVLDLLIKYNVDFDVHHSALNKRIVDELHHKGIKVNCWTVNEKKRVLELIDMGVDFITTNYFD